MLGSELKAGHIIYYPGYTLYAYNEEMNIETEYTLKDCYFLLLKKQRGTSTRFHIAIVDYKCRKSIPSTELKYIRWFSQNSIYDVVAKFKLTKKRVNNMVLHLSPVEIKQFLKVYHGGNTKAR